MCYVCGKSSNKIVHDMNCRYVKMMPDKNKKYFGSLKEAEEAGYAHCKYCAYIQKYMRNEKKELESFCKPNGLYLMFNSKDGSLDVISRTGKWKVIVNGQRHFIWLYHKNLHLSGNDPKAFVPGYHSQKICKSSLMGYMQYIVEHDNYRTETPLYKNQMTGKGKQAKKDQERYAKKVRRWQSIRYVTELLNNMSSGTITY